LSRLATASSPGLIATRIQSSFPRGTATLSKTAPSRTVLVQRIESDTTLAGRLEGDEAPVPAPAPGMPGVASSPRAGEGLSSFARDRPV
jgi:hypothetical protein